MTARFPGLVVQDWRTGLLDRHPGLFPDARLVRTEAGPSLTASGLSEVPDGWRTVVETACLRLDAVRAAEPSAEITILDVGEKWGELRLDVCSQDLSQEGQDAVELIVALAEARSAHVCETCGQPGRLMKRGSWLSTRCAVHADDRVPVRSTSPDLQIVSSWADGRLRRTARRYDVATDSFVPAPLPDEED